MVVPAHMGLAVPIVVVAAVRTDLVAVVHRDSEVVDIGTVVVVAVAVGIEIVVAVDS